MLIDKVGTRLQFTSDEASRVTSQSDEWEAIFNEHGAPLILLARQWTYCQNAAEDVVVEAFLRVWEQRCAVREPIPYLYEFVRRLAKDWQSSETSRHRREQVVGQRAIQRSSAVAPEMFVIAQENQDAVLGALAELPAEQREVIVMKLWGQLTFAAIAEQLAIPLNTAASRYRYGLEAIQRRLAEDHKRE